MAPTAWIPSALATPNRVSAKLGANATLSSQGLAARETSTASFVATKRSARRLTAASTTESAITPAPQASHNSSSCAPSASLVASGVATAETSPALIASGAKSSVVAGAFGSDTRSPGSIASAAAGMGRPVASKRSTGAGSAGRMGKRSRSAS